MRFHKHLALTLAMTLALTLLTGCGASLSSDGGKNEVRGAPSSEVSSSSAAADAPDVSTEPSETVASSTNEVQQPAQRWDQFHISTNFAFGGSGNRAMYDKVIRQTKEAYFTTIEITNVDVADPSPEGPAADGVRAVIRTALDVCRQYDMSAIVADPYLGGAIDYYREIGKTHVQQTLNAYQDYEDVLLGYILWDEPKIPQFSLIKQRIGWVREIDPDVRLYLNLLPSYNDTYTWKKNAFQEYVSTFTFDVDPEMLSVDYYVFGDRTDCNPNVLSADQGLWRDMGLFRMLALETGKPFEFYIQGVGDFSASKDIGNMTAERIAFQMYAALAYGVKRVSYFTSYGLLLDANGDKTHMYDSVKAINEEALQVGRFLYDKTSVALYHSGAGQLQKVQDQMYLDNLAESDLLSAIPSETIVSVFEDEAGGRYLMVANKDYNNAAVGRLVFKKAVSLRRYQALEDSLAASTGALTELAVEIPAGGYLLYRVD